MKNKGCKVDMDESENDFRNETSKAAPLDPVVSRALFLKWRSPQFGISNPQRMSNPVWEWLIKSKINAYQANVRLNGPSAMRAGPCWCFDRYGQSATHLPDGRVVFIAGEHEDYYDPDFYIYNDVVIQHPDGRLDIFGYPREVFPPTDFHSATLVDSRIVVIGNLSYLAERRPAETPVRILDLETFAISTIQTSGAPPGWIHAHKATLSEDGQSILVEGGKLDRGERVGSLVENVDDWRLQLADWRWERLTERGWPRWEVRRKDGRNNHLFDYGQAVWKKKFPEFNKLDSEHARLTEQFENPSLEDELGKSLDLELFARLFKPSVAHEELAKSEDEYNIHRIKVENVVVRYVEDMHCIQMTVEGDLSEKTVDVLTHELLEKLSQLEDAPCELIRL